MMTSFYPPYHFGGDGMFVYRLSEELAQRGHKVDVVHSIDGFEISKGAVPAEGFTHHPNITLHALKSPHPRLALLSAHQLGSPALYGRQLKKIFRDNQYDVIHYHNVSLMGGPGVLRWGLGLKLYTAHEYWLVCPTHVLFRYDGKACDEKRCLRCVLHAHRPPQLWRRGGSIHRALEEVDYMLMPSHFAMKRHQDEGIDRPMVHLPHFVPDPQTPSAPASSAKPYFLYVGRLEELKGVQDLIRIFKTYNKARLMIVGKGTYGPQLQQQAAGLDHVEFVGRLHPSRLSALYEQALAVLVPSLCYETFGLTAAEAMMHGTPAIVRKIGALTEIVHHGGGTTFQTDAECVAMMEQFRTDPAFRAQESARGREIAQRAWSVDAHIGRYLRLIYASLSTGVPLKRRTPHTRGHGTIDGGEEPVLAT